MGAPAPLQAAASIGFAFDADYFNHFTADYKARRDFLAPVLRDINPSAAILDAGMAEADGYGGVAAGAADVPRTACHCSPERGLCGVSDGRGSANRGRSDADTVAGRSAAARSGGVWISPVHQRPRR